MMQTARLYTMTACAFHLMERYWQLFMVLPCNGYMLRQGRFWIQLRNPTMVTSQTWLGHLAPSLQETSKFLF
nr:uncharacterized protein LOC110615877 isoform X2 [Ipomoea batatas]